MTYTVLSGTLNSTIPYHTIPYQCVNIFCILYTFVMCVLYFCILPVFVYLCEFSTNCFNLAYVLQDFNKL